MDQAGILPLCTAGDYQLSPLRCCMRPSPCENRPCTATLEEAPLVVRRGSRSVTVNARYWRCACRRDPDTGEALEFVDDALGREAERRAAELWLATFEEIMPQNNPAEVVQLPLPPADLERLDARRGGQSREAFIAALVHRELAKAS